MPSHTTKTLKRSSKPKWSSFDGRTRPTSVRPTTSSPSDIRATVYAVRGEYASAESGGHPTKVPLDIVSRQTQWRAAASNQYGISQAGGLAVRACTAGGQHCVDGYARG